MKYINITLDVYSAVICLILFCYLCFGKGKKDGPRRYFMMMCLFNTGISLGDITNWACEGYGRVWYPAALRGGTLLYYVCTGPLLLGYIGYVRECTAAGESDRRIWRAALFLCGLQILFSVLSLLNGMFYEIGTGNIYRRGEYFWLSQLIPLLLYFLGMLLIFLYRGCLHGKDIFFLLSYVIIPGAAEIIQIRNYGIALLNTGATLSILLMFINIQAERELRMQQQEKELAQSRIDIMLSQIQPHFLYNTLTTIRHLCDADPIQAKQSLLDFSVFLRANMDALVSKDLIPVERELAHVRHYLALEQQRFGKRLHVAYEISTQDFRIPPLTLQPLVENAVRHGILKREEGGCVIIRIRETVFVYRVTVEDDGVGFSQKEECAGNSHIGIDNVRGRIAQLCRGRLDIRSTPGVGTEVVITIPKEGTQYEFSCSG